MVNEGDRHKKWLSKIADNLKSPSEKASGIGYKEWLENLSSRIGDETTKKTLIKILEEEDERR